MCWCLAVGPFLLLIWRPGTRCKISLWDPAHSVECFQWDLKTSMIILLACTVHQRLSILLRCIDLMLYVDSEIRSNQWMKRWDVRLLTMLFPGRWDVQRGTDQGRQLWLRRVHPHPEARQERRLIVMCLHLTLRKRWRELSNVICSLHHTPY